jgi:hypothetical protein
MNETVWQPERPVEIVAETPPDGGLDRVARALVKVITENGLLDVPVSVVNVPGDGARRAWTYVDGFAGDAQVVSINSPNLTTDHLVGLASFDHGRYTPIATLITKYIAFAVQTGSDLRTAADLIARLGRDPAAVTVALSTALGNSIHIAFAQPTPVCRWRHCGAAHPCVRHGPRGRGGRGERCRGCHRCHRSQCGARDRGRPVTRDRYFGTGAVGAAVRRVTDLAGARRRLRNRRLARRHRPDRD